MILIKCILTLLIMTLSLNINAEEKAGFFNITHMTNTPDAIDYAIKNGANGLEVDLNFDSSGKPTVFLHGGFCDCSRIGN